MIGAERGKVLSSFLRSFAASLRQEDEDEDEPEEADAAVEEKGGGVAEGLKVSEGLGHDEPAEVGGEVGQGVGPAARPPWKNLGGDDPGEAAQAQVECDSEA